MSRYVARATIEQRRSYNAGADLEKLCEPVSHMEMPLKLSSFYWKVFFYLSKKQHPFSAFGYVHII